MTASRRPTSAARAQLIICSYDEAGRSCRRDDRGDAELTFHDSRCAASAVNSVQSCFAALTNVRRILVRGQCPLAA